MILTMFSLVHANNIAVSNVSLEGQDLTDHFCYVEFDLSWDNSWRTTSVPQNWDAAWLFVKFSVAGGPWQHATLNATGFVAPAGSSIDMADGSGAFMYRDAEGSGTNSWSDARFRWNYGSDGVADDASVEVRVFAIEMVYVPQGSFYIGDGQSTYRYYEYDDGVNTSNPYLIDGSTITVEMTSGNLYVGGNAGPGMHGTNIPSTFPTGYDAYYCMKYEISQEQYVDFLNTLTRFQQNTRTAVDVSGDAPSQIFSMSNWPSVRYRNGISCPLGGNGITDPISFFCDYDDDNQPNETNDGMDIACNYLTWMDLAAYADWAGLRPMTETEFEKACRGPNMPVANELAWGNANVFTAIAYNLTFGGYEHEGIDNLGTGIGNSMNASTNPLIGGPVRCGIFAAGSVNHTRVETGSGYYGIMELSGNVSEMMVNMFNVAGSSYTGLHGDGTLTAAGDADTDYWPGINGHANQNIAMTTFQGTTGVSNAAGAGIKGGYFAQIYDQSEVSNRENVFNISDIINHHQGNGGRLVRTAP